MPLFRSRVPTIRVGLSVCSFPFLRHSLHATRSLTQSPTFFLALSHHAPSHMLQVTQRLHNHTPFQAHSLHHAHSPQGQLPPPPLPLNLHVQAVRSHSYDLPLSHSLGTLSLIHPHPVTLTGPWKPQSRIPHHQPAPTFPSPPTTSLTTVKAHLFST